MFKNVKYIDENIQFWDVSSVEDMSGMFYGARNFNQDLNNWDIDSEDRPKREHIFVKCPVAKNPSVWYSN